MEGIIRRVNISDVVVTGANGKYGSIISGLPGHPIEELSISNVEKILQDGGGTAEQAALNPPEKGNELSRTGHVRRDAFVRFFYPARAERGIQPG